MTLLRKYCLFDSVNIPMDYTCPLWYRWGWQPYVTFSGKRTIISGEILLTTTLITEDRTKNSSSDNKKQWMGYALAISIVLHVGAALIVIFACSSSMGVKSPGSIIIEDVALAPSISTAVKPSTARPPTTPEIPPEDAGEKDIPEQQPSSSEHDDQNKAIMSTPLGLGMTHGYVTSLANGMSLRDDIRDYYFEMVGKINGAWWNRAGVLTESLRQDGVVELLVQRDGAIVSIRILQGTGSREADRLLTEILQNTRLAPLPPSYESDMFDVPLRIKAPASLFRLKS